MADFYFLSNTVSTTSSTILADMGSSGSAYTFVAEGVTLLEATNDDVITGTGGGQEYMIHGTVAGLDGNGIKVEGTFADVHVASRGSINAEVYAVYLAAGSDYADVTNNGEINGYIGVLIDSNFSNIVNTGTITGDGGGYYTYGSAIVGYHTFSDAEGDLVPFARILNSGTLAAHEYDYYVSGSVYAIDMYYAYNTATAKYSSFEVQIDNSGTILGSIRTSAQDDVFNNSGTVIGDVELGEDGINYDSFSDEDMLINSGLIQGDVTFGLENDVYRSSGGTVTGTIYGEGGDDTFTVDQQGVSIDGGDGTGDKVIAYDDIDSVVGVERVLIRGGDDVAVRSGDTATKIFGNNGDNFIVTGTASDSVYAGSGDDEIDGGDGDDLLDGEAGNDVLLGGEGDDTIRGGANDDIILGGLGRDIMTGGTGADLFIFEDYKESAVGGDRDIIRGFETGIDRIDVSDVPSDPFLFLGAGSFTAGGDAELRYFVTGSGAHRIQMDTDGDGTTDSEIHVVGASGLVADDFLL